MMGNEPIEIVKIFLLQACAPIICGVIFVVLNDLIRKWQLSKHQ
jgi:hypothetical protein